jgi:hypothetical protein
LTEILTFVAGCTNSSNPGFRYSCANSGFDGRVRKTLWKWEKLHFLAGEKA